MVEPDALHARIQGNLPQVEHLEVNDLTGTKDHYEATVVSPAFEGKSRVEQHQMVYAAVGDMMDGPVHALALKTFTPDAWKARGG